MMNLNQLQRDILDKLKDGDDSWYENNKVTQESKYENNIRPLRDDYLKCKEYINMLEGFTNIDFHTKVTIERFKWDEKFFESILDPQIVNQIKYKTFLKKVETFNRKMNKIKPVLTDFIVEFMKKNVIDLYKKNIITEEMINNKCCYIRNKYLFYTLHIEKVEPIDIGLSPIIKIYGVTRELIDKSPMLDGYYTKSDLDDCIIKALYELIVDNT